MHRSRKPFIVSWVTRAGFYAIDRLQDAWSEHLIWPIEALTPPPLQPMSGSPPLHLPRGTEGFESEPLAISGMEFSSAGMLSFVNDNEVEPSPYMPAFT
jgi:hypothetical protein